MLYGFMRQEIFSGFVMHSAKGAERLDTRLALLGDRCMEMPNVRER
jgi:hypothetical protein